VSRSLVFPVWSLTAYLRPLTNYLRVQLLIQLVLLLLYTCNIAAFGSCNAEYCSTNKYCKDRAGSATHVRNLRSKTRTIHTAGVAPRCGRLEFRLIVRQEVIAAAAAARPVCANVEMGRTRPPILAESPRTVALENLPMRMENFVEANAYDRATATEKTLQQTRIE